MKRNHNRLRFNQNFLLLALGFLFLFGPANARAQAIWDNTSFVHRSGQQILNGQNTPIKLDGVNLGAWLMWEGWIWGGGFTAEKTINANMENKIGATATAAFRDSVHQTYITRADIKKISEECFNVVRIPFNHTLLEDDWNPYVYKPEGWAVLDSVLKWCEDYNVYAVLDLHSAPGGQSNLFTADPDFLINLWNGSVNQERTKRLWKAIADRYKNRGIIAGYDLLNEPDVADDNAMLAMYADIIDSVRAVDNNHMLFIEGNEYAHDFSMFTSLPDPNMCFEFHFYTWFFPNDIPANLAPFTQLSDNLNVPIWCGEWGENSLQQLDTTLTLFNDPAYKISGNAFWTWKKVQRTGQYPYYIGADSDANWEKSITWIGDNNQPEPTVSEMQNGISAFLNHSRFENCTVNPDMSALLEACTATTRDDYLLKKSVRVFPNPFSSEITVENAGKKVIYELINGAGQSIWKGERTDGRDFSDLPKGVYFLQVTQGAQQQAIKLMKR